MKFGFDKKFTLSKPVIYADVNVFRYLAYGELEIVDPDRFIWAYSHVHFDEMYRGGNTDALTGMEILNAVEVSDVLDEYFQSVGNIRLLDYAEPKRRYEEHLEAISGMGNTEDLMIEQLIRIFGADNFSELSMTPAKLVEEIDNLTSDLDEVRKNNIRTKVNKVSLELAESIQDHLSQTMPIDVTRNAMGLGSEKRKILERSESPIDEIWELIRPVMGETDKDIFFGFIPNPATPELPHNQHGAIGGAHIILNLIGFSPDKGLANKNKLKNIMSDGQHIGMASYCQSLLSSDIKLCNKANAIYQYIGLNSKALRYVYDREGTIVNLGISSDKSGT